MTNQSGLGGHPIRDGKATRRNVYFEAPKPKPQTLAEDRSKVQEDDTSLAWESFTSQLRRRARRGPSRLRIAIAAFIVRTFRPLP